MFKKLFTSIAAALLLLSCGTNEIKLETDAFKLSINTKGVVSFMGDAWEASK